MWSERRLLWGGALALTLAAASALTARAAPQQASFASDVATITWPLAALDAQLPADWSDAEFLVLEFRASSSQSFELALVGDQGAVSRRLHPFANVWVRAAIPLRWYRELPADGAERGSLVNRPRYTYWMDIEGNTATLQAVRAISITLRYPSHATTVEVRKVSLAKTDPGDAVLDGGQPLVDDFGQYRHVSWPGKAVSWDALRREWAQENRMLPPKAGVPGCRYGGFDTPRSGSRQKATGFFRVQSIAGKWWFIDPEGCRYWSAGVSGAGDEPPRTSIVNRSKLFTSIPTAAQIAMSGGEVDPLRDPVSFHLASLQKRYGSDWRAPAAQTTARRLRAWGLNTTQSPALNDALTLPSMRHAYTLTLPGWQHIEGAVLGLPDAYAPGFAARVDRDLAQQLAPRKGDPWMLGYFIGNEPPWPGRESQLVDLVLAGPATELQKRFRSGLARADTAAARKALVHAAFGKYLDVINSAARRHDPNHLNLGLRFADTPPDDVMALARGFDVFSVAQYRWAPPKDFIARCHAITQLPVLISAFHVGVPDRGLAPGMAQALSQAERGVAYSYYVENAAALAPVVGAHWRQWIDEPVTGAPDGENYNIGWIDVTDRPYPELVAAAKATNARLEVIHAGTLAPTTRMPRASEFGSPADAARLRQ